MLIKSVELMKKILQNLITKNFFKDPGFISSADRNHGCITKSILCMPIKNLNNEVIAVVKLINRFIQNENEICQFYDCDIQVI